MPQYEGTLKKMQTIPGEVVTYHLPVGEVRVNMNLLINKQIELEYLNEIYCIRCGRKTSKSFAQGYCYPCLLNAPETDQCVLRPELCQAHKGVSRDMEWSKTHCLQDHVVYLADTTGLKVGVTRASQVPTRWIDQGATRALKLAVTPNRSIAGHIEVFLKNHFSDKTNWRNMLTNKQSDVPDLLAAKKRAIEIINSEYGSYITYDDTITTISFPVREYPLKVTSLTFDKTNHISGIVESIKGQYLILDGGRVLNIRKHNGYKVILRT